MDSEKLINGGIKFILVFGLTGFLLVKGWMGSYENIVIGNQKVTFYRAYSVEENLDENVFFKTGIYAPGDVVKFVEKIDGELFFLNEKKELCKEAEASFVAIRVRKDHVTKE